MISGVRTKVTVQAGGLIELRSDELPEGATVEVIVLLDIPKAEDTQSRGLSRFIGAAKGNFSGTEEIDEFVRQERDSWEF
ncbi:MAG: hypothetical protein F6K19_41170 [Cyanothece sp. SIO1E1]|nr:hypothetical protein [Cyanothece sp. SIO1E1]